MVQKIFFFNGPPGCGKDAACDYLEHHFSEKRIYKLKFATILKRCAHEIAGLPIDLYPETYFEGEEKDLPSNLFPLHNVFDRHFTPREFYIYVSENILKPNFGSAYFGNVLVKRLKTFPKDSIILVSDSGFLEEAKPVIGAFGIRNCHLVQLRREGRSFEGKSDSRNYWFLKDLDTHEVENAGGPEFFDKLRILFQNLTIN